MNHPEPAASENSYQKFAKDVIIIGITTILTAVSGIVLLPLLTKTLGAHDYGIWAQVQVAITLISGLVGLGLPFALTRFLPVKTSKKEIAEEFYSVLAVVFLITLLFSGLFIILASFIATTFFDGATGIVVLTGLGIFVASLNGVMLGLFRARQQMKRYSFFSVGDVYGQIVLIAFLTATGHDLYDIILALLIMRIGILLVLFFVVKSQIGLMRPRFSRLKEYLHFGLPTVPGNVAAWVVAFSDRYVISYFLGPAPVGVYAAICALGSIPMMLAGVLGFVLPPASSRLYDEGRLGEVSAQLSYSLKYMLLVAIPFLFGALVLSDPVLRLFTTNEIASEGYYIVPMVALSTMLLCISLPYGQVLTLAKKTRIIGIASVVAAVLNFALNIPLVPRIGITGAALTTIIAYSVYLAIVVYYCPREFHFTIDWRFILKSLAASAIMFSIIRILAPQSGAATILTVLLGVFIYVGLLFLLKGIRRNEVTFLLSIARTFLPSLEPSKARK